MIKNYLLTAFRNVTKHKGYSIIIIMGLAIGMAASILIWHFVSYEKSYDNFHENGEKIFRIEAAVYKDGNLTNYYAQVPDALGPALKKDFPEVLEYTRLYPNEGGVVTYKDVSIKIKNLYCTDNSILTMFSFPLVKGNPAAALAEPHSAVISESLAKKFFGDQDPIGKVIQHDRMGHWTYTIKGVFKDVPNNSHLRFDVLLSLHDLMENPDFIDDWDEYFFFTYVLLHPDADPKALEAKLPAFFKKYIGKKMEELNIVEHYWLQPLPDVYLHSLYPGYRIKHRDYKIIYFLTIIAIFILIIAWTNYVNLLSAKALERAKEVSVRKVVGSTRIQLIKQFLFESLFFNIAGGILAILLVIILIPTFNLALGLPTDISLLTKPLFWLILIVSLVIGAILAGLYPAFILSSFKPVSLLQGKLKGQGKGMGLRKILVIFQLVISILLIAGTLTVYKQIKFMKNWDLGIDTDHVLLVNAPIVLSRAKNIGNNIRSFFREVGQYPGVVDMTLGGVPGREYVSTSTIRREGKPLFMVRRCWVDRGFLDTFQIKLLAGRNFSPREFPTDLTDTAILNEVALKLLGFESPEKTIGQFIQNGEHKTLKVIGVIKNYHQKSLRNAIEPVIFQYTSHYGPNYYTFRLKPGNVKETVAFIKNKWKKFLHWDPFDYYFLDDFFNRQYKSELQFGAVSKIFILLAIFIVCIGLFALFTHTTLQRTKEIGIRKVFGADFYSILGLLLKNLPKLLIIAVVAAFPIAYIVFSKWLENYHYRIEIGLWFWVLPILIITPIVLVTVIYQVVKGAMTNPIKSLRYE